MEKTRKILTRLLLVFVLISIGFAFGRHSVKNSRLPVAESAAQGSYVNVYYMHATFRCETCNTIEALTRTLLNKNYAAEMTAGRLKWLEVDFQEDERLAKKFSVVSSCVVVALIDKGEVVDFKRLDEVWILMQKPDQFNRYVSDVVNLMLRRQGGKI